ncbi:hypothetical protein [Saccharolobus caldissimus]|uniref:Thermopsin n=1 Tax=Saccharolobus caldissimus TaxID=1702097 RepID=A0AAQ4CQ20_9CREN|nr:hypothetical protein [Saccharolobus caldissimus]BDB97901.1 hypothetical protein SACC_09180 [Saccharolobus caldissimus]
MRKSLLALLTLSLALLILAMPTGAITASQLGAQNFTSYGSSNTSGVLYGSENSTGWNQIYYVKEIVYLKNASFSYVPDNLGVDAIYIAIGLSPFTVSQVYNGVPEAIASSVLAGFIIYLYSDGQFGLAIDTTPYASSVHFLTFPIQDLELFLNLLNFENGTYEIYLEAFNTANNQIFLCYGGYFSWPYSNLNSYTALTFVEAPYDSAQGVLYSLPQISGGLIENFGFNYLYNGNVYSGPGTPVSGTSFYADVLQGVTGTNVYITLVNGWGSTGSWSYLYQFYNTNNGQTTYGL